MGKQSEDVVDINKKVEECFERGEGRLHITKDMSDRETICLIKGCIRMSKGKPFQVVAGQ
jgi:hypothetical protein